MAAASDLVVLSLYGTGIHNASALTVTIGAVPASVEWEGPHSVYPGLDQINVQVPRRLLGRGIVPVSLTADGWRSNTVLIELDQLAYLNLDVETVAGGQLWGWNPGDGGYAVEPDTDTFYSGAQSLRTRYVTSSTSAGGAFQFLPVGIARGKHVRFTAYTLAAGAGRPSVYMGVSGNGGEVFSYQEAKPSQESDGWARSVIDMDVSPNAAEIGFGVLDHGTGVSWFDNMSIDIDGVPYAGAPAPSVGEPTPSQLEWVRNTAMPFATPDAGHGFDDLEQIRDFIGDARIVGLGEATHGTSEFFRMKHRLLEFLATEMGFTVFAIRAILPGAYRINKYVLTGQGDPQSLLKGLGHWVWNTREVLSMIEWMRQFNLSGKGQIQFTGFDMSTPDAAMDEVRQFVTRADPAYLPTLDAAWALARNVAAALVRE